MNPGAILFHKQFVFRDGTAADKYLIVLANTGATVVVAKTTSKGSRYRNDHGCQAGSYFPAFLLTVGCCCLPLNTWICLDDFFELKLDQVIAGVVRGSIRQYGYLAAELIKDVQVCAAGADDISPYQEQAIRAHF